jgi:hypothetical protein
LCLKIRKRGTPRPRSRRPKEEANTLKNNMYFLPLN